MGEKDKGEPKELKRKTHADTVKADGNSGMCYTFTFSSGSVDRDNDVIEQMGIDLKPFKANPVVLWAHDYKTPPVARVIDTWFRENKLMGTLEFPPEGTFPLADSIRGLVSSGFINSTSIGFQPKEWTFDEERGGFNFKAIELMEVSLVPVPSNRDAMIEAAAKGLKVSPVIEWAKAVLGREPAPEPVSVETTDGVDFEALAKELRERLDALSKRLDEAPPPPPAAITIPPKHESKKSAPRALLQHEKEQLRVAIVAGLNKAAAREVNFHTGRLED